MTDKELTVIELTEENIESMVYEIRGQKVMLDSDLARIYGYETKSFNRQVQRNIEKFPEDFMFQLTHDQIEQISRCQFGTTKKSEIESAKISMWKKSTAIMQKKGIRGGRTSFPYAFTEQGIYMLMTVLKGELAVKQSKALIRLFKRMKDYIVESNNLLTSRDILELTNQVYENTRSVESLKRKGSIVDKKLTKVMDNFIDQSTYKHFLILDGQKIEADVAYQIIYSLAKQSIHIIDDYIGVKTLHLLLSANKGIQITIVSDNVSRNPIQPEFIEDFREETGIDLIMKPSNNRCHDRFILIDYATDKEKIYLCGSSSKDAGKKATAITEIKKEYVDHSFFDELIK